MIPAYPLENVQLLKDRVIFPYVCFRSFGQSLQLVTKSTGDYPYLSFLEGAQLVTLPENQPHMDAAVRYLSEHAGEIDLLFLFGARGEYLELAHTYKSLRPEGILYLKLDANIDWANAFPLSNRLFTTFLQECDIISCETRRLQDFLYKKWQRPIEYIPNGVYYPLYPEAADVRFEDKENMILTVGRLGTAKKTPCCFCMLMHWRSRHSKSPGNLSWWEAPHPNFKRTAMISVNGFHLLPHTSI